MPGRAGDENIGNAMEYLGAAFGCPVGYSLIEFLEKI